MTRARSPIRATRRKFAALQPMWLRERRWWLRKRIKFMLRQPETLNEKIHYRMVHDRRPLLTMLADKYAVRDYVAERVGHEMLTELHAVVDDPNDIPWSALPPRFALKATHGCGATILADNRVSKDAGLPPFDPQRPWGVTVRLHPDRLRQDPLTESLLGAWLRANYWREHGITEWQYRNIRPRLIVEELLSDANGASPADYKFWCFEGQAGLLQMDLDRFSRHTRALFGRNGQSLDASIQYPRPAVPPPLPSSFDRLRDTAERLAIGLDFVRVDLYDIDGRIVFGEMTLAPGGGQERMMPEPVLSAAGTSWHPSRCRNP